MDYKIKSPAPSSPFIEESASLFSFIPQTSPPPTDPVTVPRLQPIDYILNSGDTDDDATSLYSSPPISLRFDIPVLKEVEAIMDPAAFTIVRFTVSAIPFLPFALGLRTSDAGRASFISMFIVIVVPIIDGMLGVVIPARTWFGALMSII
ncbi:hypothetical protein L2E82_17934 [Cichorium intybus]|uniref:Uncharacterized protein n=1 Tax=Cichorium intybus TaxID=13427 RepID=A0ACB9FAE0_CICIN|nr:hypothetical protein L2E82_17934 [Cichorium intybus]